MYSIYADDICIYNDVSPLEELKLISPKLILEDSAAGSLSITVPVTNVGYSLINRYITDIVVKKHDVEIWAGRVVSEDKDFINSRVLYCEGELAFLSDTLQPQMEYHNKTGLFLGLLLFHHNEKVFCDKRFEVGIVTVEDNNHELYRFTNFETTFDCIRDKLLQKLGGHLRIRKENGVRYLDYIADDDTENIRVNSQVIEFGKNLMDLTKKWDLTDMATVIVPLGAQLEESEIGNLPSYVTVEDVNTEACKALTEKPPVSFFTSGDELLDYTIFGTRGGVGDYDSHTGKYKIQVEVESHNFFLVNLVGQTVVNGLTVEPNYNYNLNGSITVRGTATETTNLSLYGAPDTGQCTGFNYITIERGVFCISYTVEEGSSGSFVMQLKYDNDADHQNAQTQAVYPAPIATKIDNTDGSKNYICPYITILSGETVDITFTTKMTERTTAEIVVDRPIEEGESLDFSETGIPIKIPRIAPERYSGEIVKYLWFNTEIQPSRMYLRFEAPSNKLYVQSDEAVKAYGWIEKTVQWDDVRTPIRLFTKAKKYLRNYQFDEMSIELSAIDLHYLDVNADDVKLLDKIRVISPVHGMDRYFPVTRLEIPLDDPTGTIFTLGAKTGKTLTQRLNNLK